MRYEPGDRLTWNGRAGTAIRIVDNHHNGKGYVRLLLDDVSLPYWVEYDYLAYA